MMLGSRGKRSRCSGSGSGFRLWCGVLLAVKANFQNMPESILRFLVSFRTYALAKSSVEHMERISLRLLVGAIYTVWGAM